MRLKITLILLMLSSFSVQAGHLLTTQQLRNFCDTIDNLSSGDAAAKQIRYLSESHNMTREAFLAAEHLDDITCWAKAVILHAADSEYEDLQAFIDSGYEINRVVKNRDGQMLTVTDWLYYRMNSASDLDEKARWRRKIYKLKRDYGAKRCKELKALQCHLKH